MTYPKQNTSFLITVGKYQNESDIWLKHIEQKFVGVRERKQILLWKYSFDKL